MNFTLEKIERASIFAWILKNNIKNENGEPLDFHKYRFMRQIYADKSSFLVCMKAAQIGFSTYEILRSAFECRNEHMDIIYVLPSDDDVNRFSGGKTNKIIRQNPVLSSWTKDKDSIYQKQFGNNTIYYEGAWTERAALSTTAKKLVVDEFDRCKPEVVEQYDSRLQSTANPRKAFFSNPSIPGTGVSKYYRLSDQQKWHVTHSCNERFILDEDCIDYKAEIFRCPHCKGEITTEERRMGEWIATAEGEWSGYWIPLWIAPWMEARNIAEFKRTKTPEYFSNFVAGLPHMLGDDIIAPSQVLKNCVSEVNDWASQTCIIGVDTGLPIHYTVINKDGVFLYGTCERETEAEKQAAVFNPYDKLRFLLRTFKRSVLVSDQGGDLIGIRTLQEEFPGRVFLCYYRKDKKSNEVIRWGTKEDYGIVAVDRNRMIQLIVEQLRETGRIRINGAPEEWSEWAEHFGNIYREKITASSLPERDDRTLYTNEYVWKRNGADHWMHSFVYAMIGLDKYGQNLARVVGTDPFEGIARGQVVDTVMMPDPKSYRQAQVVQGFSAGEFNGGQVEL